MSVKRSFKNITTANQLNIRSTRSFAKSYKENMTSSNIYTFEHPLTYRLTSGITMYKWDQLKTLMKDIAYKHGSLCGSTGNNNNPNRLMYGINPEYINRQLKKKTLIAVTCAIDKYNAIVGFQTLHKYSDFVVKLDVGCVDFYRRGGTFGGINGKITRQSMKWAREKGFRIIALEGLPEAENSWKRRGFQRVTDEMMSAYIQANKSQNHTSKSQHKSVINSYNPKKCSNPNGCWMIKNL